MTGYVESKCKYEMLKPVIRFNIWLFLVFISFLILSTQSYSDTTVNLPDSFSLTDATDYAIQNNPDVKTQEEAINIANGLYVQTRGNWLLKIDLTLQAEHQQNVSPTSSTSGIKGEDAFASIDISQPVYTFGRISHALRGANAYLKIQSIQLELTKQDIIYQVTSAYYNVLLQEELVKVNEESLKIAREHLRTAEIRYEQGVNNQFDVTRAKVDLANRETDLISIRNDLVNAIQDLNKLFNLPPNTQIQLKDKLEYVEYKPDLEEAWRIASENRPDLNILQLTVTQNDAGMRVYASQHLPTISIGGNYSWYHDDFKGSNVFEYDQWNSYVKMTIPIFDGFKISGQVKSAKGQLQQSKLAVEKGVISAQSEVEKSVREIIKQQQLISAAKKTVELAEISLRMARVAYDNGRSTTLDVSDAELSLRNARVNGVKSLNDYLVSLAKLKKVLGVYEIQSKGSNS